MLIFIEAKLFILQTNKFKNLKYMEINEKVTIKNSFHYFYF